MIKTIIQKNPFIVPTTDGKLIAEHFGKATDGNSDISIAHMIAPPFWSEPFQTPEFDEFTLVISGKKQFIVDGETIVLSKGESIKMNPANMCRFARPLSILKKYTERKFKN